MEKYILALEIGSSKVKGAVGVIDDDGVLTVVAIEEEKLVDSVRHGLIFNVETVSNRINSIIHKLENRVSPHKARSVYVAVGGRSFMSSPREIERQFPDEREIRGELIEQLRREALGTAMSDREVMEVVDGEFYIDHRQAHNPVGFFGRNIRASFNLITCRQQLKRNITRAVSERLNLKINGLFVRQISQGNLVLSNDERLRGCMLVDLGAETTTVSIYKNGAMRYMATIPLGSRNITRDIMSLNYLEERADEVKIIGGNAMPQPAGAKPIIDGIDFTDINYYVNARATEIIVNVHEQVKYAGLSCSDLPGGIVMVGGGSKLRGLYELMQKITKMKVRGGIPSATVRIANGSIPTFDSIDVISILASASKLSEPADCMPAVRPAVVNPQPVSPSVPADKPEPEPEPELKSSILDDTDSELDGLEIKPPRRKVGAGLFNRIGSKLAGWMREEDDDDDL